MYIVEKLEHRSKSPNESNFPKRLDIVLVYASVHEMCVRLSGDHKFQQSTRLSKNNTLVQSSTLGNKRLLHLVNTSKQVEVCPFTPTACVMRLIVV